MSFYGAFDLDVPWLLLSAVTALAVGYLFLRWRRLPPGPWGLPVFGYTPFLSDATSRDFLKLREKYGNVFGLYQGSSYTVVLSKFQDIKQAYNKEEFSDRPEGFFEFSPNYTHVGDLSGWEWKNTRKAVVTALRHLGLGKNRVEEMVKEQIERTIEQVSKLGPDAEINLDDLFLLPLLNIIFVLVCGKTTEDSQQLLQLMKGYSAEVNATIMENQSITYFPLLKAYLKIKNFIFPKQSTAVDTIFQHMGNDIREHEKEFDENNPNDFIGFLLQEMKNSQKNSQKTALTHTSINGNSQALLFAGVDTMRVVASWLFLYLAKYQKEQEKIYKEITDLLGKEKPPSWSDRDSLPYTHAFILEVIRFVPAAPVADAHYSSKEGSIGGYTIPKGSIIMANMRAVHNDPELWGDPDNFRPERFMSPDGKKTTVPDYWLVFLIGKRSCPGDKLANMQMFLILSTLVQRYHVTAPKSGLSLEEHEFGFVLPVKPVISFKPRN